VIKDLIDPMRIDTAMVRIALREGDMTQKEFVVRTKLTFDKVGEALAELTFDYKEIAHEGGSEQRVYCLRKKVAAA
jgi:hypothetical protein